MNHKSRCRFIITVMLFSILLLVTGCTRTHQAPGVMPTGFLGDYSQLRPGEQGEAQLIYINPSADFSHYSKILIEPVVFIAPAKTKLSRLTAQESEMLKEHMQRTLYAQLSQSFIIVNEPGLDTLRIRVAIIEATPSRPLLDLVSNVMPIGWIVTGSRRVLLGSHSFVGRASLECEAVDSVTGNRLVAAVDRRAGRKVLRGKFSSWDDVMSAQDTWAGQTRDRLAGLCMSGQEKPLNPAMIQAGTGSIRP